MTLVEVLVSITVLTILGGALLGATDIGIRTMGRGGAADRAAGAHDFSAFEQQLGEDVTQASCIRLSSTSYPTVNPTCSASVVATCGSAVLCFAWSQYSDATPSCHIAAYRSGPGTVVSRSEFADAANLGSHHVTAAHPKDAGNIEGATVAVSATTVAPPSGGLWVGALSVTLTGTGIGGGAQQVTANLTLHPFTIDPGGQAETSLCR